jgi:(1->4)-alpha-D-glucan 1-alpha-D-glucosylmutase
MTLPRATYRLQLRGGMTFEKAAGLVPYLARLGVSHLYLSPIFEAARGSTHGYDVIDCNRLDPVLGGEPGFACLSDALARHGLGLIVDFVPNHMAATPQNNWWRDVLEWGRDSPYAHHFDVDWSAPRLIIPVLARTYGASLLDGTIGLSFDAASGEFGFTVGDLRLPAAPASYVAVLSGMEGESFGDLAREFAAASPLSVADLKAALARLTDDSAKRAALDQRLKSIAADREELHALHERQVWRLTHWRAARECLTYRRFFEISDLVGLKVERPDVFRDVHRGLIDLVDRGKISGIRLDHIDGLADPKKYLDDLQHALVDRSPFYLIVEKILGPDETLPDAWPVAGTTGYEFAKAVAEVLIDADGESGMTCGYGTFIGSSFDYESLALEAKRKMLTHNLAGELKMLVVMARGLALRDRVARDFGEDTLRTAIVELAAALSVYRTYVDRMGPSSDDRNTVATAIARAKSNRGLEDEAVFDFLGRLLLLELDAEDRAGALAFVTRFQQTTGPVMAKALEDTTFYRYNRLIALNEVGGEPQKFGASVGLFHRSMRKRALQQPAGLNATSTHDTKRGEDTRARLCALSEVPLVWAAHVARWSALNAHLKSQIKSNRYPDPNSEWLFYQALLGAWPMELDLADGAAVSGLSERVASFMIKAVREAKTHTTWTAPNSTYETAIQEFTRGVLDLGRSHPFLVDFHAAVQPFVVAGALNSFSQTLLKLVAPGVPDVYQGAESWDLSLVDPDNRRPVDFTRFADQLSEAACVDPSILLETWRTGVLKLHIVSCGLRLRSEDPQLCAEGTYVPLDLNGPRAHCAVAFARVLGDQALIAIVPRFSNTLLDGVQAPLVPTERWRGTTVDLPASLAELNWHDWLVETPCPVNGRIELETALARFPVALFATRSFRRPQSAGKSV